MGWRDLTLTLEPLTHPTTTTPTHHSGNTTLALRHAFNNQWAYYSEAGPWMNSFPMAIRVTGVTGETLVDEVTSKDGNDGTVQFKTIGDGTAGAGYPGRGVPPKNIPHPGSATGGGGAAAGPKAAADPAKSARRMLAA